MEWFEHIGAGAVPAPSLEEFQTWQKPSDLISHLKGSRAQGLVGGLLQRLANGFLLAAAGISSWRDANGVLQKRFTPVSIQAEWWAGIEGAQHYWQTLWTLGDVSVRLYDRSRADFIPLALTAVRFEASGLYDDLTIPRPEAQPTASPPAPADLDVTAMVSTPNGPVAVVDLLPATMGDVIRRVAAAEKPADQTSSSGRVLPKIPHPVLLAWVNAFAARNPDSSFRIILQNAQMAHASRYRVAERPVKRAIAELGLTLSVGNPKILRKSRRIEDAE